MSTQATNVSQAGHPEQDNPTTKRGSCDACRQKKIKCDRVLPQCDWCRHHNRICTFRRPKTLSKRRKSHLESKSQSIQRRIARLEEALSKGLLKLQLPSIETPVVDKDRALPVTLQHIGQWIGVINTYNGFPFFSAQGQRWVQDCTGEPVIILPIEASDLPFSTSLSWESVTATRVALASPKYLPSKRILLDLVCLWKTSFARYAFPLFDDAALDQTVNDALLLDTTDGSLTSIAAHATLHAFLAFTSVLGINSGLTSLIDSSASAKIAHDLLMVLMPQAPAVQTLRCILMLVVYECLMGEVRSADILMSIGGRLVFNLGAHKCPNSDGDVSGPSGDLRNLFWIAYTLDRDMALRTGNPPVIADDHCDLTLPPEFETIQGVYKTTSQVYPMDLRLAIVKSHAFNELYSVRALQKSDAELLKAIRDLDNELEQWRTSMPESRRPPLAFSQAKQNTFGAVGPNGPDMQAVLTRLNYLHCVSLVHQASSRCQTVDNDGQQVKGVRSSLDLSVQASRSTLDFLNGVTDDLAGDAYWTILCYASSAVLTIFCNILGNPRSPSTSHDLSVLRIAPTRIHQCRALSAKSIAPPEAARLKAIIEFFEELERLAPLAIRKANDEADAETNYPT